MADTVLSIFFTRTITITIDFDCWPDKHLNIFSKMSFKLCFYIDLFIVQIPSQNCWLPEDAFFIRWNILQENKHLNIYTVLVAVFCLLFITWKFVFYRDLKPKGLRNTALTTSNSILVCSFYITFWSYQKSYVATFSS